MAAKITVEITCDGCGEQFRLPGDFEDCDNSVLLTILRIADAWTITTIGPGMVGISAGFLMVPRKKEKIACSTACALKIAERLMLRPNSDEKENKT